MSITYNNNVEIEKHLEVLKHIQTGWLFKYDSIENMNKKEKENFGCCITEKLS